jgi:hypothetical protein
MLKLDYQGHNRTIYMYNIPDISPIIITCSNMQDYLVLCQNFLFLHHVYIC